MKLQQRIAICMVAAGLALLAGCAKNQTPKAEKKLIVLGFDGMDVKLTRDLIAAGRLPNFARLAEQGGFKPLQTSTPPHSPVAWSSIITGADPGEHGIFDWIHRDPKTYMPYQATTRTVTGSGLELPIGRWKFPITGGGEVLNLRYGTPFWEHLTKDGVNAHVYRIPANYPPEDPGGSGEFLTLTDMGTPDLLGSLGEFAFYYTGRFEGPRNMSGGHAYRLRIRSNVAHGSFYGPPDGLINADKYPQDAGKPLEEPFTIYRDPDNGSAMIEWNDTRLLLKQGEWTDWQEVEFEMGPGVAGSHLSTVVGVVRLYLKQISPTLQLYVSPVQIDPLNPALPISVPNSFAEEVADAIGRYYSQGLPEDTKALSNRVLTREEFLEQADLIYQERLRLLDFALDRYKNGFLFFYIGSTDQIGHMFWGAMVNSHPAITPEVHERYKDVMPEVYERVDKVVGKVMDRFPDATILCISDHGFASFARGFNVNTWLMQEGYAKPATDFSQPMNFKWDETRAYAVGINGLYVNLVGREEKGIVDPADKQALLDELQDKLLEVRDPKTGKRVIKEIYQADKVYSGPNIDIGPDIVIGYDLGFRGSWATALGENPEGIVEDNLDAWCGDHCIATDLVPGVIFANRPIELEDPMLEDIAATILTEYGIEIPDVMKGTSVFEKNRRKRD